MRKRLNRAISLLMTVLALALPTLALTACGTPDPVTRESYYFDTLCKITVYDMKDMSSEKASAAIDDAFKLCRKYEDRLSKTKKGTEIYRINHADGGWVTCSQETVDLVKKGISYGDLSGGRFDITIGKAEDLYNFHSEKHTVPTAAQLAAAVRSIGYQQIQISGRKIRLTKTGGEIDLGGIGKGYIADRVADLLRSKGVTSAIVSLGGNIVTIGDKGGTPFTIGIEKPFSDQSAIVGTVPAKDQTLVTSGVYERYFKKNGKLYHHILDPKTGLPVETDIRGVTIVSKDGNSADCDSLATYCLILGKDQARKLISGMKGYECLIIDVNGKISKTSGMDFTAGEEKL